MNFLLSVTYRVALVVIVALFVIVLAKILRIPPSGQEEADNFAAEFKPAVLVSVLWCILALLVSIVVHRYLMDYFGGKSNFTLIGIIYLYVISLILLIPLAFHIRIRRLKLTVLSLSPPYRSPHR